MAEVTPHQLGTRGFLKEMAWAIFSSGWEIHNARCSETGVATSARYQGYPRRQGYSYHDLAQIHPNLGSAQCYLPGKFYLPTVYKRSHVRQHHQRPYPCPRWVEVVKNIPQVTKNKCPTKTQYKQQSQWLCMMQAGLNKMIANTHLKAILLSAADYC